MYPRNLEVTVLSAEELRVDGKPVKRNAFVVVNTDGDDASNSKSTRADCQGGSFPSWNEKLVVPMPVNCRSITLNVQCVAGGGGHRNRLVGSASVPVSDFLGGCTPENYLHFLSYRLRDSLGQKNGIVNVSVRVVGGGSYNGYSSCGKSTYGEGCSSSSASGWRPWIPAAVGVPVAGGEKGQGSSSWDGGVAIGIPVWGASRA